MRAEADEIREWDEVERELTVLLKGIAAANLKRKHHLGTNVLKLYNILRITVDVQNSHLRPYFDAMKQAYLRRRKKAGKAEPAERSRRTETAVRSSRIGLGQVSVHYPTTSSALKPAC